MRTRIMTTLFVMSLLPKICLAHAMDINRAWLELSGSEVDLLIQTNIHGHILSKPADQVSAEDIRVLGGKSSEEMRKIKSELQAYYATAIQIENENGEHIPLLAELVEDPAVANFLMQPVGKTSVRLRGSHHTPLQSVEIKTIATVGTLVLSYKGNDEIIPPGAASKKFGAARSGGGFWTTALQYIELGFEHILPKGLDHILFVLGLFFLTTGMRQLLWQISTFTLAHTLTLIMSTYRLVNLPATVVEPIIALSISYVAIENIYRRNLSGSRLIMVFLFGLVHGLGFAGVLGELGLPDNQFFTALLSFNVGVELGQITTILLACALVGWMQRKPWYKKRVINPVCVVIASIGLCWTVERIFM